MTDITVLTKEVTELITPAIPYLLQGGEKAFEEASKRIGGETWELTKKIWMKLVSPYYSKEKGETMSIESTDIVKAATDVFNDSSDEDARATLRFQINKFLKKHPELSINLEEILIIKNGWQEVEGGNRNRLNMPPKSGGTQIVKNGNDNQLRQG
jgi:hypothetical protein